MLSRRVKFTFRGIFLRSIRVPLIQSVAEQNILYFLNLTFVKAVGDTDVRSVAGIVRVGVDSEAVSEEGVDLVTAPDNLPRVSVADSLAVSWQQAGPLEVPALNLLKAPICHRDTAKGKICVFMA